MKFKKMIRIIAVVSALLTSFSFAAQLTLLPHQQKVLNYLNCNPNLHGLILYHALGAGKTITALFYAKQQPLKTVILVPEVLKAHWINESGKVGVHTNEVEIFSYNNHKDLERIKEIDFSQNLVVVDEIQKLVEQIRHTPDARFLDIYWNLFKAKKMLLLTGTPVFTDAADVAYIGNLTVGKEVFPFHPDEFKNQFMSIDTAASLFRGYFSESKLMTTTLPLFGVFVGASLVVVSGSPWILPIMAMAGSSSLNLVNENFPINKVSFRKFNAAEFSDFSSSYISYYRAKELETKDYPEEVIHNKRVSYTKAQVEYFMDFVDGVLSKNDLNIMLKDYPNQYSDAMLHVNSSKIQQDILALPGAGREIGNLSFHTEEDDDISNKFIEIEKLIRRNKGKTAVYSSYYYNGILEFAKFLNSRSYAYDILEAQASVDEVSRILRNFNDGEKGILLIHPEITEGISLVGVEQLHILEPVKNVALEKQIIGRSVRYGSHKLLPKNRRKVDVFLWESVVNYSRFGLPTEAGLVRRDHWRKRFREVNPNLWTNGIAQLDPHYFKKDQTPDQQVGHSKDTIEGDMNSFELVCQDYSLENSGKDHRQLALSGNLNSHFAVPLLYFNYSKVNPYDVNSFNSKEELFKLKEGRSFDFNIEIPHYDSLSVGFGIRYGSGKIELRNEEIDLVENFSTAGTDLGFMTRLHHEWDQLPDLSLYWKNEMDFSVAFMLYANGLGLGVRESVGVQYFLSKHLGVNLEWGGEGKFFKDTLASESDFEESEDITGFKKDLSLSYWHNSFVTLGIFSSYF
ncbi:MAG: helicase-related protein [Oligoflexales bacterium]